MHTVQQLDMALRFAKRLGFRIRTEWLGGSGGGACQVRGQRQLFVDLAQNHAEQLETVLTALADHPAVISGQIEVPPELTPLLQRKAA